jgi:hypothetical protein
LCRRSGLFTKASTLNRKPNEPEKIDNLGENKKSNKACRISVLVTADAAPKGRSMTLQDFLWEAVQQFHDKVGVAGPLTNHN